MGVRIIHMFKTGDLSASYCCKRRMSIHHTAFRPEALFLRLGDSGPEVCRPHPGQTGSADRSSDTPVGFKPRRVALSACAPLPRAFACQNDRAPECVREYGAL